MKPNNSTGETGYAHSQLLGFQLSLSCTASCRSCAYTCGPHKKKVIDPKDAIKILDGLDASYEQYLMPFFGFTGGEPFLHRDIIKQIAAYVRNRFDFKLTISTNCYWAVDKKTAGSILKDLKKFGLAHLGISADEFHQEYVGLDRVRNAITAANDMGITCQIQCAETKNSQKLEEIQEQLNIQSNLVKWGRMACDPVGRARTAIPKSDRDLKWLPSNSGDCSMFKTWIINPYGQVTACCGSASNSLPLAGNALKQTLSSIINQNNLNPVYNALAIGGGPSMLVRMLEDSGIDSFQKNKYTGPCHVCSKLFENDEACRLLTKKLEPMKLELLTKRLIVQQRLQEDLCSEKDPYFPDI